MTLLMVFILTKYFKRMLADWTRNTYIFGMFNLLRFVLKFLVTNITFKIPSYIEQGVCSNPGVQHFRLKTCVRLPRLSLIMIAATKYA